MSISRDKVYKHAAPGIGKDSIGFFAIHSHMDQISNTNELEVQKRLVNVHSCQRFFKALAEEKGMDAEKRAVILGAIEGDSIRIKNHTKSKCIIS